MSHNNEHYDICNGGILVDFDVESSILSSSSSDETSDDDCFSTISIDDDAIATDDAQEGSFLTGTKANEGMELGLEKYGEDCERLEPEMQKPIP